MPISRMHRLGVVLAAATAVAGLTACTTTDEPGTSTTTEAAKTFNIGFVNGGTTEFHNCLQKAVEGEITVAGSKVTVLNSGQDPAKEKTNVESLIAQHVDALI